MVAPSTTTRACSSTSESVNVLPSASGEFVAANQLGVVPPTVTVVLSSRVDTVVDADCTGETDETSGAMVRSPSSEATSGVRLCEPVRVLLPPGPPEADTVRVLEPSCCSRFWMETADPLPTATSRITAATPIRMPSIVRPDRRLFARSPWNAERRTSRIFMTDTPGRTGEGRYR